MWLLNSNSIRNRTPHKIKSDYLLKLFGALLDVNLEPFNDIADEERRAVWRACLAEEMLLRHICGQPVPDDWFDALKDASPFHNDIPLEHVWDRPAACAVFPLAERSGRGAPGVGHVWIVKDLPCRDALIGANIIALEYGMVTMATHEIWDGRSWQLAGLLAQRAVMENNPTHIRQLALQWFVTGRVDHDRVKPVEIGNKHELADHTHRCWLIPAENRSEWPLRFPGRAGFRTARDTETAWRHITGQGVIAQDAGGWPVVDEFHSFTSGAREPVLAGALLTQARSYMLWHTRAEFSRRAAEDIAAVAYALRLPAMTLREVPSDDMAKAEKALLSGLGRTLENGKTVLFNITQGNRLMSYAVHSLAQQFENLLLMYRDLDAEPFECTLIRYEGSQPITQTVTGSPSRSDIDWNALFRAPTPREPEPWKDFLKKIRKTTIKTSLSLI